MRETKERNGTGARDARGAFFFKLTLAQLIVCAALLAFFCFAMKKQGPLFSRLREEFHSLTAEDWDLNEITFLPPRGSEAPAEGTGATGQTAADGGQTAAEAAADETAASEEETRTPGADGTADGASGETAAASAALAAAGGADLPPGEEGPVSFGCYTCGDTPVLPVEGTVTSGFGERIHPIYGTQGFHSGKDLAAAEGTPIHAALDGEVIGAGVGEMSGNYVKLRHENGLETLYCHCSRLNVETGVRVRKGDVIAFVGQTGLATGPHLHFEVHIDGVKRDPDYLLENACHVA